MDENYQQVPEAASFLEHLRFGRDAAEGTSRMYAGELTLYLDWCRNTGRDLFSGASRDARRLEGPADAEVVSFDQGVEHHETL